MLVPPWAAPDGAWDGLELRRIDLFRLFRDTYVASATLAALTAPMTAHLSGLR